MSGGSYDYAYSNLHELDRWVSTLEDMAGRCREWAASDRAASKYAEVDGVGQHCTRLHGYRFVTRMHDHAVTHISPTFWRVGSDALLEETRR